MIEYLGGKATVGALRTASVLVVASIGASGCTDINTGLDSSPSIRAAPLALPSPDSHLLESGQSEAAPPGFIGFCLRNPDQCDTRPQTNLTVTLIEPVWQEMLAINRRINAEIQPMSDLEHYSRAEFWTIPTDGYGDCDDYALSKRKALIEAGMPQGALRIAVVMTMRHQRHAVLTVSTDRGDFVLDNLSPAILPWSQASYFWLERQDPAHAWGWVALKDDSSFDTSRITATGE